MKNTSMPNHGSGKSAPAKPAGSTNQGACSGLKKSNDMRSDTCKAPSSSNPFPKGMA